MQQDRQVPLVGGPGSRGLKVWGKDGAQSEQGSPSSVPPAISSSPSWYFISDLTLSNSVPSWIKDSKQSSPLPAAHPKAAGPRQGWVLAVAVHSCSRGSVAFGMVFIQAAPWSLLPAACPSPWQPHLPFAGSVARQYKSELWVRPCHSLKGKE